MKKIICLILILHATNIFAQNFNKLITIDKLNTVFTGNVIINDKVYIAGAMNDTSHSAYGVQSFLAKYNANGTLISNTKVRANKFFQTFVITTPKNYNNQIYFVGYVFDTTYNSLARIFYAKLDTNLTVLNFDTISTPLFGYIKPLDFFVQDSFMYVTGGTQPIGIDFYSNPFILKYNMNSKLTQWFHVVPWTGLGNNFGEQGYCITSFNHNIIFATQHNPYAKKESNSSTLTLFFQVDSLGNYSAIKIQTDTNLMAPNSIQKLGNFYYSCGAYATYRDYADGAILFGSTFYKWDSAFNLIWMKISDTFSNWGLIANKKINNDVNFITVGGASTTGDYYRDLNENGILIKYDTIGTVLWNRQYRGYTDTSRYHVSFVEQNVLIDFDYLSDGSIIASGNVLMYEKDSISQQGWLLRLSPDGCLGPTDCGFQTGIQQPNSTTQVEQANVLIYPNPSSNEITIQIEENIKTSFPIELSLYDLLGSKITSYQLTQNKQTINTDKLFIGNYFAVFKQNNKVIAIRKIEHF